VVTDGKCIEVSLDAFRDLVSQFTPPYWSRLLPPVLYRDLEAHQWMYGWRIALSSHLAESNIGWVPRKLVSGRTGFEFGSSGKGKND
jgi:hypothetical protein